jgi:predicted helicase
MSDVIKSYLAEIDREFKTGRATEHTHRPALKGLIESLAPGVRATNEPKRVECGAPDFILRRDGLSIGYVETKDLGKSLDEAEDSGQLQRYKKSLPNLILTDYLEFRWFVDGQLRDSARLGRIGKGGKILPNKKGIDETTQLLKLFLESLPQPITTPKDLSERAAKLAHIIRDTIVEAFEKERASQDLKDLRDAFAEVLIPDLNQPEKVSEFADMYAQTIVYGLFAARVNHKGPGPFQRLGASREIPKTNPFLKKLFDSITGSSLDEEPYVDFVDDLVQILANTDMEKVLENFGKRTKQEDPIVHFYETFLAAYDPKTREKRGVYYTPEPVVQYIVKSVDHILKTRFGLEGGLAHTADIVEYDREEAFLDEQGRPDRSKLLKVVPEERPKVLILDPACGTGTFLYAVMDHIRDEFMKRGDAGLWSAYVRDHLLPRLFGFELLMAPYAVAHFKLGMQLAGYDLPKEQQKQWQYDFMGDERLGIYLTNTLDEAPSEWQKLFGAYRILSEEANAASRVKRDLPIMVVLGNPPYSGHSANSSWEMVGKKKKLNFIGRLLQDYYFVDGKPLGEKNPKWLQDDYVKFLRWGQWRIERTGTGILAFITNHGYLENPTFRGMRQQLIKSFNEIYILDLHGNSKKRERAPDGSIDENVFDIMPGVTIGIFIKSSNTESTPATVHHADVWGLRENKYRYLLDKDLKETVWTLLEPQSPFYLFVPRDIYLLAEYDSAYKVTDIFPLNVLGFQTHRDHFAIDFNKDSLSERILDLRNASLTDNYLTERYNLKNNSDWRLSVVRKQLQEDANWETHLAYCLYRPFDWRWGYLGTPVMDRPRQELIDNVAWKKNICLLSSRQQAVSGYKHCWISVEPANDCVISTTSREANQVFPLYIYHVAEKSKQNELFGETKLRSGNDDRIPNLNPDFVSAFASRLGLKFVSDGHGDLAATFGPEDVFDYIYAVFHSPTYRQRYAQFLKIDFPRVPLTSNLGLFKKLCILGEELVALHLLESPQLTQLLTRYPVAGDNIVEKGFPKFVVYEEGQPGYVYINKTQYFEGVPKEVWEFHVGGYQVCEKWLKDRRGRQLSFDDLMHYQKVIVALAETRRLMEEIDKAIPGWPIK